MKVLHTSDWHLGQLLKQQKREPEHRAFLHWLLKTIEQENIEILLICGDIFDSGLPPNYALEMYYSFLASCIERGCQNIVIIAGNHDSPATLQAPKALLKALNVHVTAVRNHENPQNDLVTVYDKDSNPAAVICTIPFLREQDVYTPTAAETPESRNKKTVDGISDWYYRQLDLAHAELKKLNAPNLPIIATGHLFVDGASSAGSERELYVGHLGAVSTERFPKEFAYIALGHIHRPWHDPKHPNLRYSGSPIPCSFDEALYEKQVLIFDTSAPHDVAVKTIPAFRKLFTISGDLDEIDGKLAQIQPADLESWVWVEYTGAKLCPDLEDKLHEMNENRPISVLGCRDIAHRQVVTQEIQHYANALTPNEVFEMRLNQENLPPDECTELKEAFKEILVQIEIQSDS